MLRLDFHSPATTEKIGYGRAYFNIRDALKRMPPDGYRLAREHTGGDVQIYFGSLWRKYREYFKRKSDIFLIYTMFESTEIPREWLDMADIFDGFIVPSEWNKEVFIKEGIDKPIYVIPLGVKTGDWPILRRRPKKHFDIIWQGTAVGDRKGGDIVEKVFRKMRLKNARLTFKLNPYYFKHRTEFDLPLCEDPPIRSIGMKYSQQEILDLLGRMDLSVYPSTGEGFGLIPLEHMATGLPVILSNNTAMSQFCDRSFNMPLQCDTVCSSYVLGEGYRAREEEIEGYILWAYENRQDALDMGVSAAEWVGREWDISRTAEKVLKLAKEVANVA